MVQGLTSTDAQSKLVLHGFNELDSAKPKTVWKIVTEVIKEPMFLLLISCGTLYILLGDYREGLVLLSTIFIIIFITFYQYQKTERALEALKRLSSPRALVIRDGVETRIPGREVVPGDVMILNEGDRIAADGEILKATSFTVDESMLTGESVPVSKVTFTDPSVKEGLVFSGTLVVRGTATIRAKATGRNTEFGKIGTSLTGIEQDETQLQKEMKTLIRRLFIVSVILSASIILLFYFSRGNFIQSLLNGLTAAMALMPEEFPVVMTIFLAMGAWRLSRNKVLTRKPSAIETLGSATILCSDKTGTITQNRMEVAALYNGAHEARRNAFADSTDYHRVLLLAHLASPPDSIDPMEVAFAQAFNKTVGNANGDQLLKEYPLTRELLMMTRVVRRSDGSTVVAAKGAPEHVLSVCGLTEEEKVKHMAVVSRMASDGYRVIAVAESEMTATLPNDQREFAFKLTGLAGLEDPIRPEVRQAVKECYDAGIKVMMITGDYPETAKSIGRQIGLAEGTLMTGTDLAAMSDEELKRKILDVTIFARVVPEQKLRIVNALKSNQEVVAMTGDGVNDAPALKAAHIGIAMGNKGTDVAREASALVLLDDNFASIVSAIRLGRRIYDNLQKAMAYILAIHIPIIGLTLLPAFFPSLPLLLLPLHIVFLELIIDPVCSVAFETEKEESNIMHRPPRKLSDSFFGKNKILHSLFAGTLLLLMVIGVYGLSINEGHTDGEVRAIAFSTLIVGNIFLILTNLSKTRSVFSVLAERNWIVLGILATALSLLVVTLLVPFARDIFSFEFPGFKHFVSALIGAAIMLSILETEKVFRFRSKQNHE